MSISSRICLNRTDLLPVVGVSLALLTGTSPAPAQDQPAQPGPATTSAAEPTSASPSSTSSPTPDTSATPLAPQAAPARSQAPNAHPTGLADSSVAPSKEPETKERDLHGEVSDHDKILRRWGVSWLGISDIPIALAQLVGTSGDAALRPNDTVTIREVSTPALGVRYWINRRWAIEPGFGVHYSGGKMESEWGSVSQKTDKQATTAMLFHAGAPICISNGRHLALLVIPEVNVGFAHSNVKVPVEENSPGEAQLRGFRLDAGARAGAEIHFGFMGMPELSLEGSIGLLYSYQRVSASAGNQKTSDVSTRLTTSSFGNPWDIFRSLGTISARYYF